MSSNYTGDDTATQAPSPLPAKSATPVIVLPADGDPLNVASIMQALKTLADGLDFLFDRVGVLDSANTWTGQQTMTTAATAISAAGKIESTGGAMEAAGSVTAGGQLVAGQYARIGTARSSAAPGAGQAVAAGEIWKDSACFAWGKVTINVGGGVCTLVRGVNVASVTKTGTGVYTVVLQTAATNILAIQVTGLDSQASIFLIDKATPPTTTTFRVLCFDPAGIATDTNGNDGGFYFEVKQG